MKIQLACRTIDKQVVCIYSSSNKNVQKLPDFKYGINTFVTFIWWKKIIKNIRRKRQQSVGWKNVQKLRQIVKHITSIIVKTSKLIHMLKIYLSIAPWAQSPLVY